MKYFLGIFMGIVALLMLLSLYLHMIESVDHKEELGQNKIYIKIKNDIRNGISRKEVYNILDTKKSNTILIKIEILILLVKV